ncbi:hypothetical protein VCV18_009262 [Metarhizium anisopliae]
MASRSRRLLLPLLLAVSAAALQVTPNSPCSSACIDSAGLDASDPNSSNTRAGDIVCADGQFDADADAAGRKLRTCLACLQGSTYTQGGEGDQAWFLYNLRYALDRCVFGYPNASAIAGATSSPCVTPESCGALAAALKSDITRPGAVSAFAYCDVDAGAATGMYFESCLQCVQADGQHAYLSNFLVVLEAACLQRPPASLLVGVNETVFSRHTIAVTQPSPPASSSPPASHAALSTPAIVGVAIVGVAALALLSGCAYMQVRKRQNRRSRARRTLSFRCRTAAAAAPPAPAYHDDDYDDERFFEKRRPGSRDASVVSMSPVARSKPCAWPLNITTSVADVPAPEPAYVSPVSAGGASSPDDATPRSSAPLLSPARAFASHLHFAGGAGHAAARPPGSPVQAARIQTTFDPPPTR